MAPNVTGLGRESRGWEFDKEQPHCRLCGRGRCPQGWAPRGSRRFRRGRGQPPGHLARDAFPLRPPRVATSFPLRSVGTKNITPLGQWTNGPNGTSLRSLFACPRGLKSRARKCGIAAGARSLVTPAGARGGPSAFLHRGATSLLPCGQHRPRKPPAMGERHWEGLLGTQGGGVGWGGKSSLWLRPPPVPSLSDQSTAPPLPWPPPHSICEALEPTAFRAPGARKWGSRRNTPPHASFLLERGAGAGSPSPSTALRGLGAERRWKGTEGSSVSQGVASGPGSCPRPALLPVQGPLASAPQRRDGGGDRGSTRVGKPATARCRGGRAEGAREGGGEAGGRRKGEPGT